MLHNYAVIFGSPLSGTREKSSFDKLRMISRYARLSNLQLVCLLGVSTEDGKVVIHNSGAWSFNAIVSFEGEVDGMYGTLQMSVNGRRPDVFTDWEGRWVILSGTGELSALHGQGTWWGPGAPEVGEWGDIYYAGKVH